MNMNFIYAYNMIRYGNKHVYNFIAYIFPQRVRRGRRHAAPLKYIDFF